MNRMAAIVLAILLTFSLSVGANAVTSKTTSDVGRVVGYEALDGTLVGTDFSMDVVDDTDQVTKQLEEIYNFVNDGSKAPVEFFDDTVKDLIAAKLPEGTDLNTLEMDEFVTIETQAYEASTGDIRISFEFGTQYADGQKLVALVGVFDADGNVEWIALDAVVEDGQVKVSFTKDVLEKLNGNQAALAILSEPV